MNMPDSFEIVESPLLDEWDELWSGNFLDMDGIIMEMNPIFIRTIINGRFCREDADFAVSYLDNLFGSRNSDAEDFTVRELLLLEIADSMGHCCVAGDNNNGCTLVEEELDSFLGVLPDGRIVEVSVRTSGTIPEIQIIVLR